MPLSTLLQSLLTAGRNGDFGSIAGLPGAGVHRQVCILSERLSGPVLDEIASLPTQDRVAFAKALALYENSVGGLGSVTALRQVLGLFKNEVHEGQKVIDWILSHTNSLWYYAYRADDFIDPEAAKRRHEANRVENERRNYELAAAARARKAERATSQLFNAVRRGDSKAVQALLRNGAEPTATAPDGTSLVEYAEANGRKDIAEQLRNPTDRPPSAG